MSNYVAIKIFPIKEWDLHELWQDTHKGILHRRNVLRCKLLKQNPLVRRGFAKLYFDSKATYRLNSDTILGYQIQLYIFQIHVL